MKRYVFVTIWFLLGCVNALYAQNIWWEHTHAPYIGENDFFVSASDSNGDVYIGGGYEDTSQYINQSLVMTYDGQNWGVKAYLDYPAMDIAFYKGDIYIGGDFGVVNNSSMPFLARYNGETWEGLGDNLNESVSALKVIDDTLYVGGFFSATDSFPYSYVAKYDGAHWYGIPDNPFLDTNYSAPWIKCFARYQGNLYIGGNFVSAHGADLTMYSNGSWHQPGQGITGFDARIEVMEVYQGDLYAAGVINQNEGNAGNYIQKWNGENWSQVGSLLYNDPAYIAGHIRSMMEYNNALYIEGKFEYAGNTQVNDLARWDGTKWCGMHHLPESVNYGNVSGMFVLDSTIYFRLPVVANDSFFDDDEIYRWIGGDDYGPCVSETGLREVSVKHSLLVTPNPANGYVFIENTGPYAGEINVRDLMGKLVLADKKIIPGEKLRLRIADYAPGVYVARLLLTNGEIITGRFIKM